MKMFIISKFKSSRQHKIYSERSTFCLRFHPVFAIPLMGNYSEKMDGVSLYKKCKQICICL